jgi:hypothetical protein
LTSLIWIPDRQDQFFSENRRGPPSEASCPQGSQRTLHDLNLLDRHRDTTQLDSINRDDDDMQARSLQRERSKRGSEIDVAV